MAASDFGQAFKAARSKGLAVFDFQGKKYHTKTKEEMEAAVKAVAPDAPSAPAVEKPSIQDAPNVEENTPRPAAATEAAPKTTRVTADLFSRAERGYDASELPKPATRASGANDGAAANVSTAGPVGPRNATREVKRGRPITFSMLSRRDERGYNK